MSKLDYDITKNTKDNLNFITDSSSKIYRDPESHNYINSTNLEHARPLDIKDFYFDFNNPIQSEKLKVTIDEGQDISNYRITSGGIIEDHWDIIHNIPARLLEFNEKEVVLECLIDTENKIFQNRKIEAFLIQGIIPMELLYPVIIKIFKRKGEQKTQFIDGKNLIDLSLFEEDYFKNISPELFNKKF